jgi:hypothetical protein
MKVEQFEHFKPNSRANRHIYYDFDVLEVHSPNRLSKWGGADVILQTGLGFPAAYLSGSASQYCAHMRPTFIAIATDLSILKLTKWAS